MRRTDAEAADVAGAMLRYRTALHLAQRLGSRANQVLSPRGAARTPGRRAAALVCAFVDVASGLLLRRDGAFHLWPRLALDSADLATWCALAPDEFDAQQGAVIPGTALAVEAGARLGVAGFAIPLAQGVVAASVRRHRRQPLRLGQLGWQVAGTAGGIGLAAYGRRRRRAELERHRREIEPRLEAAELAGRNAMATGVDTVFDAVQRATVLIDLARNDLARNDLARNDLAQNDLTRNDLTVNGRLDDPLASRPQGIVNPAGRWKQELAVSTRGRYAYAGDVLLRWQARHNAAHADLHRTVVFEIAGDSATIVIDPTQVDALLHTLDSWDLRGRQPVTLTTTTGGRRHGDVVIRIGPHERTLGSTPDAPVLFFDPVPGAFLWSALWMIVPTSPSREHVPMTVALPPAVAALAAAAWTHRVGLARSGRAPRPAAVATSFALSIAATTAETLGMRNSHTATGISRYPFGLALQGYQLVAFTSWNDLSQRQRVAAVAGSVAIVLTAFTVSPQPRHRRELFAEIVWPVITAYSARTLPRGIDENARAVAEAVRIGDENAIDEARGTGQVAVQRFLEQCLSDAELMFREHAGALDDTVRAEARRRLDDAARRLRPADAATAANAKADANVIGSA